MKTIKPMRKVSVTFRAGAGPDRMDIRLNRSEYGFIFGIGSEGLTPFEYQLAGLTIGQEITLNLHQHNVQQFFKHLCPPVLGLFHNCTELFVTARITAIAPATSREVIKAMADVTAHSGSGCSCDGSCGCS